MGRGYRKLKVLKVPTEAKKKERIHIDAENEESKLQKTNKNKLIYIVLI